MRTKMIGAALGLLIATISFELIDDHFGKSISDGIFVRVKHHHSARIAKTSGGAVSGGITFATNKTLTMPTTSLVIQSYGAGGGGGGACTITYQPK